MRYRQLGKSKLLVSELALGTWLTYGETVSKDAARSCLDRALSLGINFIDTANMYGNGATESTARRSAFEISQRHSTFWRPRSITRCPKVTEGLSREQIHKQIDASLKRLNTDYVDLYQCHAFDSETPLEETMEALERDRARWKRHGSLAAATGRRARSGKQRRWPVSRSLSRTSRNTRC